MGKIEENWQPAKFYCSEIKLIYSKWFPYSLKLYSQALLDRSLVSNHSNATSKFLRFSGAFPQMLTEALPYITMDYTYLI